MTTARLKGVESETYTVEAGKKLDLDYTGRFARCYSSNGTLQLSFNHGTKSEFRAGIKCSLPIESDDFTSIQLYNETGEDITVTLGWGYGDVDDNSLSVSGDLAIKNSAEQPNLNVFDSTTKNKVGEVLGALKSPTELRAPLTPLAGATITTVTNNTTIVVPDGANINGVIIRLLTISTRGTNGNYVKIGSQKIYAGNPPSGSSDCLKFENLLVDPGDAIELAAIGSNSFMCIAFEVL